MPIKRRRNADTSPPLEQNVLARPSPGEAAGFSGARMAGHFAILDWDTAYGTVGLAHSLRSGNSSTRLLTQAVYGEFRDHMHEAYTALVLPQAATNLDGAPQLDAVDLYPDCRSSDVYEPSWRQLAAVLGAPVPWFHLALRD